MPLVMRFIKNLKHFLWAVFSAFYFGFPARKMTVIGITGTDGKTTTATLIYKILVAAGQKVALVSTVGAKIGTKEIDTGLHTTTPNSWNLQQLIHQAADLKTEYLILETTSHGLDQHRLWGINFTAAVMTNVSHEHLDYHHTMANYLKAKAKLFQKVKWAILNKDDKYFNYFQAKVSQKAKTVTYSLKPGADLTPKNFPFKTKLLGDFNQSNCLAAIAVAIELGVAAKIIRKAITNFEPVVGRMEKIQEGQNFEVFVDFAHTPNALENTLKTLKKLTAKDQSLIAMFGSAGFRDQTKRPLMGEAAAHWADQIILTADDPRTESLETIVNQLAKGCLKLGKIENKDFFKIYDRGEAIAFAFSLAKKGDIVALCGKGHEKSLAIGKKEIPWSDQQEARKLLKKHHGQN